MSSELLTIKLENVREMMSFKSNTTVETESCRTLLSSSFPHVTEQTVPYLQHSPNTPAWACFADRDTDARQPH